MDQTRENLLYPWERQIDETKRHNPCGVPFLLKQIAQDVEDNFGDPDIIKALLERREEEISAIF